MKRVLAVFLAIAVFAGITGAVMYLLRTSGPQKEYKFDLIVKGTDAVFWKYVDQGAQAAAASRHTAVTMLGPANEKDYLQQVGVVEQAIASRPDAIILAAGDYNLLAKPVQKAIDAGIPVVTVDSDVDNHRTVAYIGTDNRKLGTQLAQQLCSHVKGGGKVGVVSFVKESYPAVQREEGFRSAMRAAGRFTLLDTVYGESDTDKTERVVEKMLAQTPALAAIAALNQQSSEGAARALSKLGRRDIGLFAVDCSPEEAMYMEDGIIKQALLQNPYQMGYYGVEAAYRHLKGGKVENRYTDIYPVNIDTLFDDRYQQLIFPFNS